MVRKIIKINENKCDGCGLCVSACHEGAIGYSDGKAKLLRDGYCDGLGDCLPVCPTGAISFEEREAEEYNEKAAKAKMQNINPETLPCGCPGTQSRAMERVNETEPEYKTSVKTHLNQWPVQIKLIPVNAPYLENAHLLIAADCTAYSYGNFHAEFMKNRITLIGCPKLDEGDYSEKLSDIFKNNNVKSVKIARMKVPCCGGIENSVKTALRNCGKMIPWQVATITADGKISN